MKWAQNTQITDCTHGPRHQHRELTNGVDMMNDTVYTHVEYETFHNDRNAATNCCPDGELSPDSVSEVVCATKTFHAFTFRPLLLCLRKDERNIVNDFSL